MADKLDIVRDVLLMPKVEADTLIHDDMCTFEPRALAAKPVAFASVKHFIIGKLHRSNLKCKKKMWTPTQERRLENVPSENAESSNGWIRSHNFV